MKFVLLISFVTFCLKQNIFYKTKGESDILLYPDITASSFALVFHRVHVYSLLLR